MNKSETIKELSIALSKFQGEVHNPNNTAINPFFKSKYAPLSEVLNTARPLLAKQGLSIIQNNYGNGEAVTVTTTLIHSSGEYIESGEMTAKPEKNTAQAMGAVITYLRRYQISSMLGLSSEDDTDGNETPSDKKPETPPKKKPDHSAVTVEEAFKKTCDLAKLKNLTKEFLEKNSQAMFNKPLNELSVMELVKIANMIKSM